MVVTKPPELAELNGRYLSVRRMITTARALQGNPAGMLPCWPAGLLAGQHEGCLNAVTGCILLWVYG